MGDSANQNRRTAGPLPVREWAEGCALAILLVPTLMLLSAPLPLVLLVPVQALAWAVAWPLRAWDPPARQWVVALARVATVWFVAIALPLLYFSVLLLLFGFPWPLLLELLGFVTSWFGTARLREGRNLAGVLLKLVALAPLTLFVAATGAPGWLGLLGALVGWITVALVVALCATAGHASRRG